MTKRKNEPEEASTVSPPSRKRTKFIHSAISDDSNKTMYALVMDSREDVDDSEALRRMEDSLTDLMDPRDSMRSC